MPPTYDPPARCWAEVDLGALRANAAAAVSASGGAGLMAVVKANAYGHGLAPVAAALDDRVAFFGVANAQEAAHLSASGIRSRIYLLGATYPDEREAIIRGRWTPCLSSVDEARDFNGLAGKLLPSGETLRVHLAADTGMGRGGFLPGGLLAALPELLALPHLDVEGLGSHLPSPDEDREFTRSQAARFASLLADAAGFGARFRHVHLANSAGLLGYPAGPCNLVRPGLMLYGVSPLPPEETTVPIAPVLSLKARITLTRTLPAGHGVSYGRTIVLDRPTRVATIAIGYGDGYPRHLSGRGASVLIGGVRCPVLGRVTMDQIMVDAAPAGAAAAAGAEAVLIGAQGAESITATEIARLSGTIPWEVFTRITGRVSRQYLDAPPETA